MTNEIAVLMNNKIAALMNNEIAALMNNEIAALMNNCRAGACLPPFLFANLTAAASHRPTNWCVP